MVNISFSWDDGSKYDLIIAELFQKYGYRAMFYIPTKNYEHPYISREVIKEIYDMKMEIGGHTSSHYYLNSIINNNVENEIKDNKFYLEDITQNKIEFFCYPGGFYNKYIEEVVKKHFKRARSAKTMRFNVQDTFTFDTSFHFFDRGIRSVLKNVIVNDKSKLFSCLAAINYNFFEFYKKLLISLNNESKIYSVHIWGHGWEIEEFKLWRQLEDFLFFINQNNLKI
jgi:peptidoglycan/xylan/chitin deacetylase (PgdA/CDA1 family)